VDAELVREENSALRIQLDKEKMLRKMTEQVAEFFITVVVRVVLVCETE